MNRTRARPRRFLFVTWNGGGNVHPAVALATRLRSRGHDVRALGPGSLAERFADEGLAYCAHRSPSEWSGSPVIGPGGATAEQRRAYCAGMAEDVLAELGRAETDVAVVDYMQPDALCAVERSGVPCAAFVHTLHRRMALAGGNGPMAMAAIAAEIATLRSELGRPPSRECCAQGRCEHHAESLRAPLRGAPAYAAAREPRRPEQHRRRAHVRSPAARLPARPRSTDQRRADSRARRRPASASWKSWPSHMRAQGTS